MNRSKQEDRHECFIRGDALAAEVSFSCFPNLALLIELEGQIRNASISNRADRRNRLSTTSNLLFGNLPAHLDQQPLGNQFMIFARDGLNSFPGVPLHQGVDNRVPVPVARYGLDWYSSFKPSRFQFFSIKRPSFAVRSFACGATVARTSGA